MSEKPTPRERMAAAHAAVDHEGRRTAKLAAIFRPNDRMERLIQLSAEDPEILTRFGSTTRIEVGLYRQQRDAAGYTGEEGDDVA